ncbi:MAG: chalcone isomerase family protein [Deltaproteobacteria bacterium]|nr:chalcone isomerase family protein [Deltaproteobacteria bacterium]
MPSACGLRRIASGVGVALALAHPAAADKAVFPGAVTVGGRGLLLRGPGPILWKGILRVCDVARYLPDGTTGAEGLADGPRRLAFHYHVAIRAAEFAEAADHHLAENVPAAELARLRPPVDELHRLYRYVKKGDGYWLTCVPGRGTELALNGIPLGLVEGADFAAAHFRIWLGERPVSESLRKSLLGPAGGRP